MNITIDIFTPQEVETRDGLANLVRLTETLVSLDVIQLLALPQVDFTSNNSITANLFDPADVAAVVEANNRSNDSAKLSLCFKDFSKLPTLIRASETLEDFL